MKIPHCLPLLLVLVAAKPVHAGFTIRPEHSHNSAIADSTQRMRPWHGRHITKTPQKQVAAYGVLSLAAGVLSAAGFIALLLLWPPAVGLAVALVAGTLLMGTAAIFFADRDSMNIRPHPTLSLTGFLLGFLAILPVLFPLSLLFIIYSLVKGRGKRRHSTTIIPQ